jgi:ADP-ribose pyrophosphatase YjhB (NUDIX family)
VLVVDDQGRLLLGRRGKQPNFGTWVVPGGGIQFGERWIETAQRELREETGLDVQIEPMQRPFVLELVGRDEHRVILYVCGTPVGGTLVPASDLLDARFFSRDDLPLADLSPAITPVLTEFGWIGDDRGGATKKVA